MAPSCRSPKEAISGTPVTLVLCIIEYLAGGGGLGERGPRWEWG